MENTQCKDKVKRVIEVNMYLLLDKKLIF